MSNNPMDAPHTDRRPLAWRGRSPAWTSTPPTEPGWYWVYRPFPDEHLILDVWFDDLAGQLSFCFGREQITRTELDEWLGKPYFFLGPLPVPAPPVDAPPE